MLQKIRDYSVICLIGSVGYSLLDILWRGFTHWTMAATGGLCLTLLYRLDQKHSREGLFLRCLKGATLITAVEFLVGCLVNRLLKWQVWDYSNSFGNLLGQVCPLYSLLWFFLCIPVYRLTGSLRQLFRRI